METLTFDGPVNKKIKDLYKNHYFLIVSTYTLKCEIPESLNNQDLKTLGNNLKNESNIKIDKNPLQKLYDFKYKLTRDSSNENSFMGDRNYDNIVNNCPRKISHNNDMAIDFDYLYKIQKLVLSYSGYDVLTFWPQGLVPQIITGTKNEMNIKDIIFIDKSISSYFEDENIDISPRAQELFYVYEENGHLKYKQLGYGNLALMQIPTPPSKTESLC